MAMVSVTGMRKFVVGFLWRSDFACAWAYGSAEFVSIRAFVEKRKAKFGGK
jgi:hypothetical protein